MLIARYPTRTTEPPLTVVPDKPVYSVAEVCALLGLSRWTVVRLFENERGVLIVKRRRRIFRIPRAVYFRVKARLEV
jgi:AraC-like DNA-binding protein